MEVTTDTPTDTDTTEENALLIPNPKLLPKLRLRLILLPGIMVVTMDTPTDIADTTVWDTDVTMADTTDTPTDTDTTEENALLILKPKLLPKLPLRLRLIPLPGIMVVTMDTPTDIADTTVWDTDVTIADTTDIVMDTTVWDTDVTIA